MTIAGRKLSIFAVFAAFALFLSIMPFDSAEAQRRGGFGPGGRPGAGAVRGGGRHVGRGGFRGGRGAAIGAGVLGAAIIGGALLAAPRARAVEVEEGPGCYFVRERVWDDYRDRWVRVNRRVCD
jgi:hypothetical protein